MVEKSLDKGIQGFVFKCFQEIIFNLTETEYNILKESLINKKVEENTYKYIGYRNRLKKYARENRKNPTKSAMRIWEILKNKQINGYRFIQEKPLNEFIADFYCAELLLVIEVDGVPFF